MVEEPRSTIEIPQMRFTCVTPLNQGWTQEAARINGLKANPNEPCLTGTVYVAEQDTHRGIQGGQKFLFDNDGIIRPSDTLFQNFNHGDEVDIFLTENGLTAKPKA